MANQENTLESDQKGFFLLKIIATLFSIIAIRMFLDKLAYQDTGGYLLPQERVIHASLYYFSVFFYLSILYYFFTKELFKNTFNLLTKIMLFVLSVPLFDILFKGIEGTRPPIYLIISKSDFISYFFKIINPLSEQGITLGQHIGAYAIFITLAFFIYKKTKSWLKSLLSIFLGYAILFFDAIIPSIINIFSNRDLLFDKEIVPYFFMLQNSWIANMVKIVPTDFSNFFLQTEVLNTWHEILLARFFWIYVVIEILIIFFLSNKRAWNILRHNLPKERIIYWTIISIIGIIINQRMFGDILFSNPANFITLAVFFLLIVLNIVLAVFINDAEDIEIDKISNPSRPLVKKEFSPQEWNLVQTVLLIIIVLGLLTLNNATAFLLIFAQAAYYLYSARPLRLKRHFLLSSVLIGFATVFVAMAGFFLVSPDQSFFVFPVKAMLILGLSYALVSNLKDIKDFEGDSHEDIKTIPVVFGLKNGKRIIAILCALVIVAVPIILKLNTALLFSVFIAAFLFYLFTKEKYQEKYIFLVIFLYIVSLFIFSL